MKIGLVLEGGGVRGIFTAGVLDVFLEEGIGFDGVMGVSAGAIHGCSYLSGQKGRSLRYYKKYCKDPRFMSWRSFLTTGDVAGVDFCYRELPEILDPYDYDAFRSCGVPFYVTCSNLETGQAEHLPITDMKAQIDLIRASASLPYFSRIVEVEGKKYLDGGATDSIPVEAMLDLGFDRCVVVPTQSADYRKKPELRALAGLVYRKYPAFAQALKTRHEMYNRTLDRIADLEKEGRVFVIRPVGPLGVSRLEHDPEKIQGAYDAGRTCAMARRNELLAWLKG